jgi:hypothetical protein
MGKTVIWGLRRFGSGQSNLFLVAQAIDAIDEKLNPRRVQMRLLAESL